MSLSMDTVITILGILSHISPRRKDGERDADGDWATRDTVDV